MLSSRHRRTGWRWGQEEAMAYQESSRVVNRRAFLRMVAGAATGAAVAGGIPAIVAAQKPPSFPKGTTLNMLEWVSFVPASDVEFKRLAAEFGKLAGVEITVDQINMNDLNPRIASAIETRSGPDIIMMISNWPHLYADGLADVDDVAEEIAKRDGAYYEHNRKVSVVDNRWKAVPLCSVPSTWTYRDDWFKEAGATKFPDTWDELRKVGIELKKKGRPLGQAFGHSLGDQGRSVMKYSKNQQVAKEFLRWFMDRPQYDKWMAANDGYVVGPTPYWEKHALWERDPKLVPFKEASKYGRWPGYPGPPSRKASEALVKYILVDMYAQAIKGMKPEDAAKWAESELKKAYA